MGAPAVAGRQVVSAMLAPPSARTGTPVSGNIAQQHSASPMRGRASWLLTGRCVARCCPPPRARGVPIINPAGQLWVALSSETVAKAPSSGCLRVMFGPVADFVPSFQFGTASCLATSVAVCRCGALRCGVRALAGAGAEPGSRRHGLAGGARRGSSNWRPVQQPQQPPAASAWLGRESWWCLVCICLCQERPRHVVNLVLLPPLCLRPASGLYCCTTARAPPALPCRASCRALADQNTTAVGVPVATQAQPWPLFQAGAPAPALALAAACLPARGPCPKLGRGGGGVLDLPALAWFARGDHLASPSES